MTRDGFCFLAMGFTGKEAGKWKEKYINAFNEMEKSLSIRNPASMEALNALSSKMEGDKDLASKCGKALSEYKMIKKENEQHWKKAVEDAQLTLGIK